MDTNTETGETGDTGVTTTEAPAETTAPAETSFDGTPVVGEIQQVAQEVSWLDSFSDEDKGKIQNKGYKTPEDMWKAYVSINSHMGADEKNLLRMPNDGEPMDEVHMRLGRPKTAEEYTFTPREGFEGGERLDRIRDIAFKNGVSGEGYKQIIDEFVNGEIEQIQQAEQQIVENRNVEIATLKAEWGVDYDKKLLNAASAARAMGASEEMRNKIRDSVGLRESVDFFNEIFKLTGEDTISKVNGEVSGERTVEQMEQEIKEIQQEIGSNRAKNHEFFREKGAIYRRFNDLQNSINILQAGQ